MATQRQQRILVIDDEPLITRTLSRALSKLGEVVTAPSGSEALALIKRNSDFTLVMCDVQLSDITGQALQAEVGRRYPSVASRFVFITGGDVGGCELDDRLVLLKPLRLPVLQSLVSRIVAGDTAVEAVRAARMTVQEVNP